ncbi:unnamed protein product [Macrosiphum euphorbiae]|uniref:Uncharacterized protein n=1 Tax=Macrosiphum euphorbiae TaxID=13131 RepID=A0AAV0WKN4_9HEMI|nr:unnamed protein product [Macrosiphum euphorbiae]
MSFPTKQGLAKYLRNHRWQVIVEAAAVPLPLPVTRQRLRANPAPIPTRGGDDRVPVVQTVDVPRIPAGNRPPDTGGTPLPPTPRAEPRRPDGSRPPDTGGSASNPTGTAPSIVVASPELWRPRDSSPASNDNSSSSGVAAKDDDLLGVPLPEPDAGGVGVDEGAQILRPDDTTPLHEFRERFTVLNREPCSEEVWLRFVSLVDEMTAEAAVIVKLPVRGRRSLRQQDCD